MSNFHLNPDRPLDDVMIGELNAMASIVIGVMQDMITLLPTLQSMEIITEHHADFIASGQTPAERVHRLIDVMRRRSVANYMKFISHLKQLEPQLASVLRGSTGGTCTNNMPRK